MGNYGTNPVDSGEFLTAVGRVLNALEDIAARQEAADEKLGKILEWLEISELPKAGENIEFLAQCALEVRPSLRDAVKLFGPVLKELLKEEMLKRAMR